jgi:hypothetical protein
MKLEEIKDLLLTSKVDIDWKETLKTFSIKADDCNRLLHKIMFFKQCRANEKNRKVSRKSSYALLEAWENFYFKEQNTYPGDLFYFPYKVRVDGHEVYFDDMAVSLWLKYLLDPEYKLQEDYKSFICYALTLKKTFYELATLAVQGVDPPSKLILRLYMTLETICDRSKELWLKLVDEERRRMTNSQNASTTTDRLEKIKGHDKYPELDKLAKMYIESPQKSTKTRKKIDKLISDIIITNSSTTIRRYRRLIFDEYQNDRKAVSDTQK